MNGEEFSNIFKKSLIITGAVCFAIALVYLPNDAFSWSFLLILVFSVIVAPRMSIEIPGSRFAISFSDAAVFLALLYYGGAAAIVVAAVESLSTCLYLRSKGFPFNRLMIPTNTAISVVSIASTFLIWVTINQVPFVRPEADSTQHLFVTLGYLAILQFVASSFLVAAIQSLSEGSNIWTTWKRDCFSSSLTQVVGAGLAGIIYKLIFFGDLITGIIAFLTLSIAYLSYRQSIGKVRNAISLTEAAEREKAFFERASRVEAEKSAEELAKSLKKEEEANALLRKSEKDLRHSILHDALTGLPNRKRFGEKVGDMIEQYKQDPSATFAIMFLDIRKFKNINDLLGHTIGDKVLNIAAKRFVRMLNSTDVVARIGGDEFAVIIKNISTAGKAQKVARRIFDSIAQPFSLSGNNVEITINIGIAACDTDYDTPEEMLRDADIAMHYAKEKEIGVAVYTKELGYRFLERVRLENDLRCAIDRGELSMNYQPLINIQDGSLLGFEALLRWNHSEHGLIPPNKFIPIAEDSRLIVPITVWILRETTNQLARWQKISAAHRDLIVSVNISGKHLSNDNLIYDVENALVVSKIEPSTLKLEITESSAMENAEHTITMLNRLKHLGVQISIDDFGTGYSSLSYLHRLPFDTLKIDRSFVYSVGENGEGAEILQTIIMLSKNLKRKVIAEGIETPSQLSLLQNLGCDYGQGYLLARPMSKDNAEKSLYERKSWLPVKVTNGYTAPMRSPVEDTLPVF